MLVYIEDKPYAALSITGKPIPILEFYEDYMQCVIECPYCGQRTTVGDTIMCSGFVGCPNCYFVPSGLLETVEWYRENDRVKYTNDNFYKKGFIENREDRVLKKNCKTTNVLELCKMNRRSRNMNKLIYAFDFDGTIVTNEFPEIGTPIMNVVHLIHQVKAEGHYTILNTMREDALLDEAIEFCKRLGVEFDAVNDNLPHMKEFYKNNPRKIFANFYIDDHNMFVDGVNEKVMMSTGKYDRYGAALYEGDVIELLDGSKAVIEFGTFEGYCPVDKCWMDSVGFYCRCLTIERPALPLGPTEDYAIKVCTIDEYEDQHE